MNKIRQDDSVFADFGVHKLCRLAYVFAIGELLPTKRTPHIYRKQILAMCAVIIQ